MVGPSYSLHEQLEAWEAQAYDVDLATTEHRRVLTLEMFRRRLQGKTLEEVADDQTSTTVSRCITGTSSGTAVAATELVGELMSIKITDEALYPVAVEFVTGMVVLLRKGLTDEQGSAVLKVLDRCVRCSSPDVALCLLRGGRIGTIARWLNGATRLAAKLLLEAVVIECKKAIEGGQNFNGSDRANVIHWVQTLREGVTDAACLGLAIYTVGANPEDLAFLDGHLTLLYDSVSMGTMPFLVKAAESCFGLKGCGCKEELGHTGLHAMLVLERCADIVRIRGSFHKESLISCCISNMNPQTNNAMALLAAHAFIKCVEAKRSDAGIFDQRLWPALVNLLAHDCVMCKKAGALAIQVLLKHYGADCVITPLVTEVDGPDGTIAGQAFAKALVAAVTYRHAGKDEVTPAALRPFNWQPSRAQEFHLYGTSVSILGKAAKVNAAAQALVAEQVGSMMLQQIRSGKSHLAFMLIDASLHLVKNTTAFQGNQQEDPILLNDPEWLPAMLAFTESRFREIQKAALQVFEQLVSRGLKLRPRSAARLADGVLAILEGGREELFRPAALAFAALVCNQKGVSDHLLKQNSRTARLGASFAANRLRGGRTMLHVTECAAGATALEALLQANPVWAQHLLKANPATGTDSGIVGDLVEILGYAVGCFTKLEVCKVRASIPMVPPS